VQFAEGMYAARKARKTMTSFRTLLDTTAPDATILVGAVFLSEGIQKFLFSVTFLHVPGQRVSPDRRRRGLVAG